MLDVEDPETCCQNNDLVECPDTSSPCLGYQGDSCYHISPAKMTFAAFETYCAGQGMIDFNFRTQAEVDRAVTALDAYNSKYVPTTLPYMTVNMYDTFL